MREYLFIFRYYLIEKVSLLALSIFFGFLVSLSGIVFPLLLGKFFQLSFGINSARNRVFGILDFAGDTPAMFLTILGGLLILRFAAAYLSDVYALRLSNLVVRSVKNDLFSAQMNANWQRFSSKPMGNYLAVYSGNMQNLSRFIEKGIVQFCSDVLFLLCSLALFFSLSPFLSLIVLITCLLSECFIVFVQKQKQIVYLEFKKEKRRGFRMVQAAFAAFHTNWMLNKNKLAARRYETNLDSETARNNRLASATALINAAARILPWTIIFVMMLCVLVFASDSGQTEPAIIVVFFLLTINIGYVLRRVVKVKSVWDRGINQIGSIQPWIEPFKGKVSDETAYGGKKVQQLTLEHIDLGNGKRQTRSIQAGEPAELVFSSRAAMVHFLHRILGAHATDGEHFLLDGRVIKPEFAYEVRRSFAVVSSIFPAQGKTLEDALFYSLNKAKRNNVISFFETAGWPAPDLTRNLNPAQWSYKEEFMFQLCRAYLSKKPFLFLDEALEFEFKTKHPLEYLNALKQFDRTAIITLKTEDPDEISNLYF